MDTHNTEPCAHTHEDVQKLIYKMSHVMSRRYFIPFEEVLGQANLLFVYAYDDYVNADSDYRFITYLQNILYWRLTDWCKREYRHNVHAELLPDMGGHVYLPPAWVADMKAVASDEARLVLNTVLASPKDLKRLIKRNKADGRKAIKATLKEYLIKLGWLNEEINKGFREVTQLLTTGVIEPPKKREKEKALRRCKLTKGKVWLATRSYRRAS